jgi:DNA-binding transcriptional LysR family regulator
LGGTALDTRRLRAFIKIVDIGSFTRAAAILYIAQPALSQQVATLETHFRRKLLVRSKSGVRPTEAGRILYKHAQVMLRQLDLAGHPGRWHHGERACHDWPRPVHGEHARGTSA